MSQALTLERGMNLGNSGQLAVEPEIRMAGPDITFIRDLSHPIGDNRNPAGLEAQHIYGILAAEPNAFKLVLPRDGIEGRTLGEIANLAWTQEGNFFDLVQTGIIGLFAWEHSPLVLAGEGLQLGYLKLKTLEKNLSLDEAAELPISDTSPDLFKGLSWLLTAATVASVLPVPANLFGGKAGKAGQAAPEQSKSADNGGQGPEFKIPGWLWAATAGTGLGFLISACARAFGLPEPGVKIATNTPDAATPTPTERSSATHTATLIATPTETPFFGGGGAELQGGSPDQIKALLEAGMNLPITDCVTTPETGGDQKQWDSWIKTLTEQGANALAIADLRTKINAKLTAWGIGDSTSLELCGGGDGGWSFAVRDNSSGLFWWSYDLKENRFADRPDRVFQDRDWQFKPMPREGLKSGLKVEIMMINGWPLAVAVNPDAKPIQHFDPVLREFINFYPETPTPTRTATATPTTTNTPRPTAIPATAIPKPSPTFTPEPIPTALPEKFASALGVLPTKDELIRCATGVNLNPEEVDFIGALDGLPYNYYHNRILTNNSGILTFVDGRVEDIRQFPVTRILQILVDGSNRPTPTNFENEYSVGDFVQLIKSGDFVGVLRKNGETHVVALYCNAK